MNLDEELVSQAAKHETHITNELPAKMIISVTDENQILLEERNLFKIIQIIFFFLFEFLLKYLWKLHKIYKIG